MVLREGKDALPPHLLLAITVRADDSHLTRVEIADNGQHNEFGKTSAAGTRSPAT
ncbi:hypothetical protein [Nonomuraea sp. NPDC049400]|uniref:hypothetical protein n=1 Tax=Nonomuraea sp. NPDC049400 TaxID=3364352 RepID=UPI003799A4E1